MDKNKSIGLAIGKIMDSRNLTQQQVADGVGVSREIVNHWIQGTRQIKAEHIIKLAKFFNVSADYILGLSEAQSYDADTQAVSKLTGLTDTAIDTISKTELSKISLSDIIESKCFMQLVNAFERAALTADRAEAFSAKIIACENANKHPSVNDVGELFYFLRELKYTRYQFGEICQDLLEDLYPAKRIIADAEEALKKSDWDLIV